MENVVLHLEFLKSNFKKEALDYFRNKGTFENGTFASIGKGLEKGTITNEEIVALAEDFGYTPEALQEEPVTMTVPNDVKPLEHTATNGTTVKYAMLAITGLGNRYWTVQYGNTKLYVAIGSEVQAISALRKANGTPYQIGELIPVVISSGKNHKGYDTGIRRRSNADTVMAGQWESVILNAVYQPCIDMRKELETEMTRQEKIAVIEKKHNVTNKRAVEIFNAEESAQAQETAKALIQSSSLFDKLFSK